MTGKSKSSENKQNSTEKEEVEASEPSADRDVTEAESIDEPPVVIEGEAVEVETAETADSRSDDEESPAEDAEGTNGAVDETASSDPLPSQVPPEPAASAPSSGISVLALLFGGIVAGAIGYFGAALAPEPQAPAFDSTELTEAIAANSAALESIESDVSTLESVTAPEVDLSGVEGQIASVSQSLESLTADIGSLRTELDAATGALGGQVTQLEERIVALETAVPAAGDLATGDELSALRTRIEDMMAEAESRLADAQREADELARAAAETRAAAEAEAAEVAAAAEAREAELEAMAERQAALLELQSAVASGASYADVLPTLESVPDTLAVNAETGVPTMQSLQEAFPSAARLALAASETVPEDATAGERLTAFLKRRTNARSLTPQEGDSPDAVLSRAEARLGEGDLAAALAELDSLPEPGQAALSDWLDQARARLSAVEAIDELTATN